MDEQIHTYNEHYEKLVERSMPICQYMTNLMPLLKS